MSVAGHLGREVRNCPGRSTRCGTRISVMLTVNHLVTSGTFSLDGGTWDVDNNVWVLGDDAECVVIDAPHDADAILSAVGPRRLTAILCTHAHDDHVDAAAALAEATRAPIWLHPADRELWDQTYPDRARTGTWPTGRRSPWPA